MYEMKGKVGYVIVEVSVYAFMRLCIYAFIPAPKQSHVGDGSNRGITIELLGNKKVG